MRPTSCDLSNGVIVIFSGGPFDLMNPIEVRDRMDQIITDINADPWVVANSGSNGLIFQLLPDQPYKHVHQTMWRDVCNSPQLLAASPILIIGHSNGGAAAMDLARALDDQGKAVDLLFTADSVLTLDDNGDPFQVPANVQLNLNSYSVPVFPIWWMAPFPFGQKNQRQADGSLKGVVNIGLRFEEPGALEHRDVFYDLAGGDLQQGGYQYPQLIRDVALEVLKGATNQEIFKMAERYLQTLADEARISIYLEADQVEATLAPRVAKVAAEPPVSAAALANLRQQMNALERMRLSTSNH